MKIEEKIKNYFEKLNPKKLGLKGRVKVENVKRLGMGSSNSNYLVFANGRKFVFRLNTHVKNKNKIRKEYEALRIIEKYGISPRVWLIDESRKIFDSEFLILDYVEGIEASKIRPYMSDKLVKDLGKLLGKLHSIKIADKLKELNQSKENANYDGGVRHLESFYLTYLKKNIKNREFWNMVEQSMEKLYNGKGENDQIISQGDFCEDNIIIDKDNYSLIDFESLELHNRYGEIAFIFVTYGKKLFDKRQKKLFLSEYKNNIKKSMAGLEEKVEDWIPQKIFLIFLWAVKHLVRIKNKEFHTDLLNNVKIEDEIKYVSKVFRDCIKLGVIDKKYAKLNLEKFLLK